MGVPARSISGSLKSSRMPKPLAVRLASRAVLMPLAVVPPLLIYAWLYIQVGTALAGFSYLASLLAGCVMVSRLEARIFEHPPDPIFGCSFVLATVPGLFLSLYCLVPLLQIELYTPALGVELSEAEKREDAQFFSFQEVTVRGDLSYRYERTRRKRNGDSYSTTTDVFQVAPLESSDGYAVWLVSGQDEGNAFSSEPQKFSELSALRATGRMGGYEKAIELSCEKHGLSRPSQLLLLERSEPYPRLRERRRSSLLLWLSLYLAVFTVLGVFVVWRDSRTEGER